MSTTEHDEKLGSDYGVEVTADSVDTAAQLLYGKHEELDPAEADRIKCVFWIVIWQH
jgi:hypothetical protein